MKNLAMSCSKTREYLSENHAKPSRNNSLTRANLKLYQN